MEGPTHDRLLAARVTMTLLVHSLDLGSSREKGALCGRAPDCY